MKFSVRSLLWAMLLVALVSTILFQQYQLGLQRGSMSQEIVRKDKLLRVAESLLREEIDYYEDLLMHERNLATDGASGGERLKSYKEVSPWNSTVATVYPEGYWTTKEGQAQLEAEEAANKKAWDEHPAKSKDKKVRDAYWAAEEEQHDFPIGL